MAACSYWNPHINSTTLLLHGSLFMIIFYCFFLMTLYVTPLNFSIPQFTAASNVEIRIDGDASFTLDGIQITKNQTWSAGRASYFKPLHLWDKASQNLADFTTHFSFVIDSQGSSIYADGLAFFLVPSNISNVNNSGGIAIGLPINIDTMENTSPFVAGEFDTGWNVGFDPPQPPGSSLSHVGININSMVSKNYSIWNSNVTYGSENEAWISYSARSQILDVHFTGFVNNTRFTNKNLSYAVDARKYLPEWVTIGFSASTGSLFEKHNVKSWEFSSNLQIDERPADAKNKNTGLAVGLSVGLFVLIGGLDLVGIGVWKSRSTGPEKEEELALDLSDEFEKGSGPKKFSYGELAHATNNFSEEEKLGEGGFGGVYRGFLRELNSYVAIKRVSRSSKQGLKEYASEVKIVSRLRHRNLVQLIGWCHEKRELILVYEFMPNGSLDLHLFKGKSLLTWAMRYKIAQGLASALLYLHEEWEQCVLHRDIKSSNIMLDSNFNAKLGDFGLARFVDHEKGQGTTILAGTIGYMAPECVIKGKASKESDVYGFGVVALEIASGRKPFVQVAERTSTVEWIWELYGTAKLLEAADSKICGDFDDQEMACLLIVGLWCAHPDYNLRPSTKQAIQVLNFDAPLPNLPLKMPPSTYNVPPVVNSSVPGANDESASCSQTQSSVLLGR